MNWHTIGWENSQYMRRCLALYAPAWRHRFELFVVTYSEDRKEEFWAESSVCLEEQIREVMSG